MLTELLIPDDRIEITRIGVLEIREATVVLRDGVQDDAFTPAYHRYTLSPGEDVTGRAARIQAVAAAVWTPQVVADYEAYLASLSLAAEGDEEA